MIKGKLTIKEIQKACNAKLISGDSTKFINNFSKDTREIKKGDMYVAIKGENTDGNEYIRRKF